MTIKQLTEIEDGSLTPSNKKLDATLVQISANAANKLSVAEDGLMVSVPSVDLSPYYTSSQTDSAITAAIAQAQLAGGGTEVDLSGYATTEELIGAFTEITTGMPLLVADEVNAAIASVVDGAPETFDTLKEIATWIETEGVSATDLASDIAGKADKSDLAEFKNETEINALIDDRFESIYGPGMASNLTNIIEQTQSALDAKVDKVEGKGLSTEDFTTAYKTKLDVAVTSPEVSGIVDTYVMEVYNPQFGANLSIALDTKANTLHSHTISDVTGLEIALENKLGLTSTAISATKLATPRTINGVNFDGTANITVADSTKLPITGGTINGNLTVTGSVTLDTVLPISSGGTGATTLTDLKAALGIPQFIQITQEDYDSLSDNEKNDPLKLYLIIG